MLQRRKETRRLAYLGGRASFFRRQSTADVLIRNTSDSGAKLVIDNGDFLPDDFDLEIPAWRATFRAHACWRRHREIGVEFR